MAKQKSPPWFPWCPSDWMNGTKRLSLSARGLYADIISETHDTGRPPPNDIDDLCARFGYKDQDLVRAAVAELEHEEKIDTSTGFLINWRAVTEAQKQWKKYNVKAGAGRAGAEARWGKNSKDNTNGKNGTDSKDGSNDGNGNKSSAISAISAKSANGNHNDNNNQNQNDSFLKEKKDLKGEGAVVVAKEPPPEYETVLGLAIAVKNTIPKPMFSRTMASQIEAYVSNWMDDGYSSTYILDATEMAVAAAQKNGDVITSPKFIQTFIEVLNSREKT